MTKHLDLTSAYLLSALIALLAIMASAGGLFIDSLYRDNYLVSAGWYGNDLVTLGVAVPVLIGALILSMRGSPRARLVWLGMLDYTLYNFAFYLFGTTFNRFFLIYAALFTLSILALIFGLTSIDIEGIARTFHAWRLAKWVAGYMLLVAVSLGAVYIAQSLRFIVAGQPPQVVLNTGHPTSVVFALDLSLVVPFFVLRAIWLWRRRPWGYVLGAIMNVKGAAYMLALRAASLSSQRGGVGTRGPSTAMVLSRGRQPDCLNALAGKHPLRPKSGRAASRVECMWGSF